MKDRHRDRDTQEQTRKRPIEHLLFRVMELTARHMVQDVQILTVIALQTLPVTTEVQAAFPQVREPEL